jgi:ABC-type branched-subunit amino acid transport system substrate-binding protein
MVKDTALSAAYDAQRLNVPIITLTRESGVTDIGDYVFRNFLTNADEIRGLVRYLVQARGLCSFAVLYPDDAYGKEMKDLFSREVGYYGCSVIAEKSYADETQDFRSTIKELLSDTGETTSGKANFDALFIPDYYNVVGMIIPYIFFFDLKGLTLIGTDGWNDPGLVEITGDFLIGSYFADAFTPNSNRSEVKEFVEDFVSIFGREPGVLEAYGYDTIKMIQYLVKTQGIDGRGDMREALFSIRDYRGVTGYTSIERNGDSTKEPMILTVMESEEEPLLTIAEEPEEGVAIAEEIPKTVKKKLIIVEVPDSLRY